MICWIASYPKSGNTFCRILLSEYLYGDLNQPFNFSGLDQIKQFPNLNYYSSLLNNNICKLEDLKNKHILIKYSIYLQKNEFSNGLHFLKTHSSNFQINDYKFTNNSITSCAIYLVRDPRNVLISHKDYLNESLESSFNKMTSENFVLQQYKNDWYPIYKIDSWNKHVESWQKARLEFPVKFVKYEDLVLNTYETFLDVLLFIKKYSDIKVDSAKIKKVIERTTFIKLQELETKGLFKEKSSYSAENPFFNKGISRDWHQYENDESIIKMSNIYKKEIDSFHY